VQDLIPPGLIDCVWFCDASEGSVCSEKGLDDIVDSVSLTANGWVDYTLVCRTTTDPQVTEVAQEATVQLLGDVTDPVPANNTGLDIDQLTSSLPECPAALVSVAFAAPFDPADPPSRVGGVADEEGHPLRISIRRILSLEPDDAVPLGGGSGGRCEPPGTTHLRLRRDGRPAPEPIYQIEFTVDGGRGGICAAVAAVRGTAARGRFGEAPSPGASCALP
jgi:hypothetical protein